MPAPVLLLVELGEWYQDEVIAGRLLGGQRVLLRRCRLNTGRGSDERRPRLVHQHQWPSSWAQQRPLTAPRVWARI